MVLSIHVYIISRLVTFYSHVLLSLEGLVSFILHICLVWILTNRPGLCINPAIKSYLFCIIDNSRARKYCISDTSKAIPVQLSNMGGYHESGHIWAAPSEFVASSIPSWQTLTAHAQPFRGARDLAFCLKVPLDSLLVWASSEGSGETARMRRLAWTFAARIGYKYQIRLTRSIW